MLFRSSVGSEDALGLADLIQLAEGGLLDLHILESSLDDQVEEKLFGDCFETHDQVEGMGCFLSREKPKPKPVFTNN